MYQAAWGMDVERRPGLDEYYAQNELPSEDWEGFDPRMDMDWVKLKMAQQQGLDASQMGYYPQQIAEANLMNPTYPEMGRRTSLQNSRQGLEQLMARRGMSGHVREVRTPFPGVRLQVNSGV
jgi:hypothetical protein